MKGAINMAGLAPFNGGNSNLPAKSFEDFYKLLNGFFNPKSLDKVAFKLDVHDSEKEYVVEAELPGTKKDEIKLGMDEGRLTISISRQEAAEDKNKNYLYRERHSSSMSRSVYLPDANEEGIKAKMENGVLRVTVPKQGKSGDARKIEIE